MPTSRFLTCEDYREIPYWFGVNRCVQTIIAGVAVG